MNSFSTDSDSRERLAFKVAAAANQLQETTENINKLHKELLEINLSTSAYILESEKRLKALKLSLTNEASSSFEVVQILTKLISMLSPGSPVTRSIAAAQRHTLTTPAKQKNTCFETNNNYPSLDRQNARAFALWFQKILDEEKQNLIHYLAEDVVLDWFGRTIKTRKKVWGFLKIEMQSAKHDFVSIDVCRGITPREINRTISSSDSEVASPQTIPPTPTSELKNCITKLSMSSSVKKRTGLRSISDSPKCEDSQNSPQKKKSKIFHDDNMEIETSKETDSGVGKSETKSKKNSHRRKLQFGDDSSPENIDHIGDNAEKKIRLEKPLVFKTPTKSEQGRGGCLPSTSGTGSMKPSPVKHPPKCYVECKGFLEFFRTRGRNNVDVMKWERKCKLQVGYSDDPTNGDYIISLIKYTDENKCRRNLLSAFEEVERKDSK